MKKHPLSAEERQTKYLQVSWLKGLYSSPSQHNFLPVASVKSTHPITVAGPLQLLTGFPVRIN